VNLGGRASLAPALAAAARQAGLRLFTLATESHRNGGDGRAQPPRAFLGRRKTGCGAALADVELRPLQAVAVKGRQTEGRHRSAHLPAEPRLVAAVR